MKTNFKEMKMKLAFFTIKSFGFFEHLRALFSKKKMKKLFFQNFLFQDQLQRNENEIIFFQNKIFWFFRAFAGVFLKKKMKKLLFKNLFFEDQL